MNPSFHEVITASDADRRDLFLGAATRLPFKGGTSLSKAFGLISRFSEDIDITGDYIRSVVKIESGATPFVFAGAGTTVL